MSVGVEHARWFRETSKGEYRAGSHLDLRDSGDGGGGLNSIDSVDYARGRVVFTVLISRDF